MIPAQDLQVYNSSFQQASHAQRPQRTHWRSSDTGWGVEQRSQEYWAKLRGSFAGGSPCLRITGISAFSLLKRLEESLLFGWFFPGKVFFHSVKACLQIF